MGTVRQYIFCCVVFLLILYPQGVKSVGNDWKYSEKSGNYKVWLGFSLLLYTTAAAFNREANLCAFMSLSAILTAENMPLIDWSSDWSNIFLLIQGDKMYLRIKSSSLISLRTNWGSI